MSESVERWGGPTGAAGATSVRALVIAGGAGGGGAGRNLNAVAGAGGDPHRTAKAKAWREAHDRWCPVDDLDDQGMRKHCAVHYRQNPYL